LLREREDLGFKAASDLVTVGRLGRPWGVRGAITLRLHEPDDDLSWAADVVWLEGEAFPSCAVEVAKFTEKGSKVLMQFAGVNSPQDVSALTHLDVRVPREWLPEPAQDEHFVQDLLGMAVIDELRGPLGTIERVFTTGANDVWVVRGKAGEELIPAIKQVVLEVDAATRTIRVQFELI
jgi:16S rRNA processing protein RimM